MESEEPAQANGRWGFNSKLVGVVAVVSAAAACLSLRSGAWSRSVMTFATDGVIQAQEVHKKAADPLVYRVPLMNTYGDLGKGIRAFLDANRPANIVVSPLGVTLETAAWQDIQGALDALQDVTEAPLRHGGAYVKFWETVSGKSLPMGMAKSPDKKNAIWMESTKVSDGLLEDVLSGTLDTKDPNVHEVLNSKYDYSFKPGMIWSWGPEGMNTCFLVDETETEWTEEQKKNIIAGFQLAMKEGPGANEPMLGVVVKIMRAELKEDCEGHPMVLTANRAILASVLTAKHTLMKPVIRYKMDGATFSIRNIVMRHHCKLEEVGTDFDFAIHAKATVSCSADGAFGVSPDNDLYRDLKIKPSFGGFEKVEGDTYDATTEAGRTLVNIRKRKGLGETPPSIGKFMD